MDIITEVKPPVKQASLPPDFIALANEATALHTRLLQLQAREQMKNAPLGHLHPGDPARIARLQRLVNMAADRWRRRMGCKPIYTKDGRERLP
jgi:hypothetical protein